MSLTDENNMLVKARVASQRGGNENAARAVELDVVGVTDEKPLQIADLVVERRKPHQSRLEGLPRLERINQQAAARVSGEHQAAMPVREQHVAVPRRNRQAAFGIERQVRNATKDRAPAGITIAVRARPALSATHRHWHLPGGLK